jgi:PBP1b-binding outer membrane lipoprotein LpoB
VLLRNAKVKLLVAVLLGAVLVTGCAAGGSGSTERVPARTEDGRAAETGQDEAQKKPEIETAAEDQEKQATETTAAEEQPQVQEQSAGAPAKQPQAAQEKPLVIISENPVVADTGQLLVELDKELEQLLGTLGAADDITEEELDF